MIRPDYDTEVSKIRQMNEAERLNFNEKVYAAKGQELLDNGCVRLIRYTCGFDVFGFAIYPPTMEMVVTIEHYNAERELLKKLGHHHEATEIITGLLFSKSVPGFSYEILQLFVLNFTNKEHVKKVGVHFLKEKKWIPIDSRGNIVGD